MQFQNAGWELVRRVTAPICAAMPLRFWPSPLGAIHGINVPSRVRPYPEPTCAAPSNINILLSLLDSVSGVEGAVAECGVYQGSSLVALALHLKQQGKNRKLYGFDSFEGFGASIRDDLAFGRTLVMNMSESAFSNTSVETVSEKLRLFGLRNVELIKGFFEESLARCKEDRFAFVHLDGDTFVAYRDCLAHFYPLIPPGGVILFDEYDDPAWPGCNKAVDEFLVGKPEKLQQICRDNFVKYYIVKV